MRTHVMRNSDGDEAQLRFCDPAPVPDAAPGDLGAFGSMCVVLGLAVLVAGLGVLLWSYVEACWATGGFVAGVLACLWWLKH